MRAYVVSSSRAREIAGKLRSHIIASKRHARQEGADLEPRIELPHLQREGVRFQLSVRFDQGAGQDDPRQWVASGQTHYLLGDRDGRLLIALGMQRARQDHRKQGRIGGREPDRHFRVMDGLVQNSANRVSYSLSCRDA